MMASLKTKLHKVIVMEIDVEKYSRKKGNILLWNKHI